MTNRQEKRVQEVLQLLETTSREVREVIVLKAEQGDFISLSEIELIACDVFKLRHTARKTLTDYGVEILAQRLE